MNQEQVLKTQSKTCSTTQNKPHKYLMHAISQCQTLIVIFSPLAIRLWATFFSPARFSMRTASSQSSGTPGFRCRAFSIIERALMSWPDFSSTRADRIHSGGDAGQWVLWKILNSDKKVSNGCKNINVDRNHLLIIMCLMTRPKTQYIYRGLQAKYDHDQICASRLVL